MTPLLQGKAAIVTGGASPRGVGLACAQLFAEHGARVLILDLDADAAASAATSLPGPGHFGLRGNVTDKPDCEAAAALAAQRFGRIDILVNSAGIASPQRLMEVTPEMYSLVMDVNMRGTLYMTQAVVPAMRRQHRGSIVNISGAAAQCGGAFSGAHCAAAKAATLGYTQAAARELGPDNIRVNAICPNFIDTVIAAATLSPERVEAVIASVPMGRLGHAHEVAGCALFLASELSSFVTGSQVGVNGGSHLH